MSHRSFLLLLCAGLLALLPGCHVAGDFPRPTAQWETYSGQMHYTSGASSVVGEVVVRRTGTEFQLAFSSGPGFPLMRLWFSGSRVRAEGLLARKGYAGWKVLPAAWLAIAPAHPAASGAAFRAEGTFPGGLATGLEHLEVNNTATGERFTFHFSR